MDLIVLFATRILRMFSYGALSVVLALYLTGLGLREAQVGLILTLTLAGDALISLLITTRADRLGRKRMLVWSSLLVILAGVLYAITDQFLVLLLAGMVGVISPSGYEVGPFLAIEQAGLAEVSSDRRRTSLFAWYNLAGSFSTASGALVGGWMVQGLQVSGMQIIDSYRTVLVLYAVLGVVMAALFSLLSPAVEAPSDTGQIKLSSLGLGPSRNVVLRLAALFSLDAFAGGLVVQSFVAYWFTHRFALPPGWLGSLFFFANILAGFSSLLAARVARRFGLINTMVFTHLPSNILLILVPLVPSLPWAVILFLMRFSVSQMDVPTRQSYTMAVVQPGERAAAAGVTNIARTAGAAISPLLAGPLYGLAALSGLPFILAGSLKILYDLLLYRDFRALKPPEEVAAGSAQ